MNYYPSQLRQIIRAIEGLDAIERDAGPGDVLLKQPVHLIDGEGTDYGYLVDEADAWSWIPSARDEG